MRIQLGECNGARVLHVRLGGLGHGPARSGCGESVGRFPRRPGSRRTRPQPAAGDLESRDGKLMTLFVAAKILGPFADPDDPRLETARDTAERVVKALQAG